MQLSKANLALLNPPASRPESPEISPETELHQIKRQCYGLAKRLHRRGQEDRLDQYSLTLVDGKLHHGAKIEKGLEIVKWEGIEKQLRIECALPETQQSPLKDKLFLRSNTAQREQKRADERYNITVQKFNSWLQAEKTGTSYRPYYALFTFLLIAAVTSHSRKPGRSRSSSLRQSAGCRGQREARTGRHLVHAASVRQKLERRVSRRLAREPPELSMALFGWSIRRV